MPWSLFNALQEHLAPAQGYQALTVVVNAPLEHSVGVDLQNQYSVPSSTGTVLAIRAMYLK